jgi:hypothetical protein
VSRAVDQQPRGLALSARSHPHGSAIQHADCGLAALAAMVQRFLAILMR